MQDKSPFCYNWYNLKLSYLYTDVVDLVDLRELTMHLSVLSTLVELESDDDFL